MECQSQISIIQGTRGYHFLLDFIASAPEHWAGGPGRTLHYGSQLATPSRGGAENGKSPSGQRPGTDYHRPVEHTELSLS